MYKVKIVVVLLIIVSFSSCKKVKNDSQYLEEKEVLISKNLSEFRNKNYPKALQSAYSIFLEKKDKYGNKSIETLKSLNHLGGLYLLNEEWEKSERIHRTVLKGLNPENEDDIPSLIFLMNNLGVSFYSQNKKEEALAAFNTARNLSSKFIGRNHPHTQMVINNLALTYSSLGLRDRGKKILNDMSQRVFSDSISASDIKSSYYWATINNLIHLNVGSGNFESAKRYFDSSKKISDEIKQNGESNSKRVAFILVVGNGSTPSTSFDCEDYFGGGGNGPFNPDPQTGGEMAQCANLGGSGMLGIWDWGWGWDIGDLECPMCPPCPCNPGPPPIPDPTPDDSDEPFCEDLTDPFCLQLAVDEACMDCGMDDLDNVNQCFKDSGQELTLPFKGDFKKRTNTDPVTVHNSTNSISALYNSEMSFFKSYASFDGSPAEPNLPFDPFLECLKLAYEENERCETEVEQLFGRKCYADFP